MHEIQGTVIGSPGFSWEIWPRYKVAKCRLITSCGQIIDLKFNKAYYDCLVDLSKECLTVKVYGNFIENTLDVKSIEVL